MSDETKVPETKMPTYIQRTNCTEEEVNTFIVLGYTPYQITPVVKQLLKDGRYASIETELIYHFIKKRGTN